MAPRPNAARAEVVDVLESDGTKIVEWAGLQVRLPGSADDWDPDALEAFETGKAVTAVRALLGSAKYETLKRDFTSTHGRRPVMRDMGELLVSIAQVYGFGGAGE